MKPWPLSLVLLCSLLSPSIAGDTITPNTPLSDGKTLVSAGGNFELGFFSPGNLKNRYLGIWYKNISTQTVVWVANREAPLTDNTGSLNISSDGNLILSNQAAKVFWSTSSSLSSSPVAQLLDTGNFVLKEGNNDSCSLLWQSFDHPCDTLLPGMKLGLNFTTGLDLYLTTWKSTDDPSPGDYSFKLDPHGSPEFFIWKQSTKEYRSGPWDGIQFDGEPEMNSDNYFTFEFFINPHAIYYTYKVVDSSIISRFMLNQSMIQRYVWFNSMVGWSLYWSIPKDQCDYYAECGPYGICNSNDSPICNCLYGFSPKSPQDWNLRDGHDGCVRKTSLDCQGDGFVRLTHVKLPDTSNSTVNESMSLEQCRESCLNNCSCVAYAPANISGGGACIIWKSDLIDIKQFVDGGQDLYVRLAASELSTGSTGDDPNKKKQEIVIFVICIASGLLLLVSSGCYIWHKKFKSHSIKFSGRRQLSFDLSLNALGPTQDVYPQDERNGGKELELPLFELSTIVIATDNFSIANKLGEGGFGTVYKGELEDGQGIAVKRSSRYSLQGVDEFKNEVMLIAKLQHINLVRLLGCCMQGEDRMLIYEYMHNRSLDTIIFDKTKCALLTWQKRFNIILGIARGLLYLHQDSRLRIIHRDLKASNILLDKDMNPKISDFGIARIFGGDQIDAYTKRVVGTYGYMSPEYAMDGVFSVKSDVFSFGVLVLEIISGKKNRGIYATEPNLSLLSHAWKLWKEGNSLELLDKSMGCSYSINDVLRCIQVGLLCVQDRAEDRPHMSTVILMLGSASTMLPSPNQPGYCSERSAIDAASSCTVNEITMTMLAGR
ncbi:receptor-like serine/threonine-protein kinase SD1-8 isoform X2 [Elaeis guineensis]|uniref:receptor-like serine/threonine-protein kinase SD1-8 isoform X2 n=1 Tax=Elaeis guineensis var. tenera TaxID=51953 RepID=UPI003C6D7D7C